MQRQQLLAFLIALSLIPAASAQEKQKKDKPAPQSNGTAIIWRDPGDIKQKNLFLGPGDDDKPQLPVNFKKEDSSAHSPKFDVTDAAGVEWKAKLGPEAQPEPVASRLM